jgi:hypothetical protein
MMRSWLGRWGRREAPAAAQVAAARRLEEGIDAHRQREWSRAEPLLRAVVDDAHAGRQDRQVARNILGTLLERTRRVEEAADYYRMNARDGFVGSYPYERLAAFEVGRGNRAGAARVLQQAVDVVKAELVRGQSEVAPQLARLRGLLAAVTPSQGES